MGMIDVTDKPVIKRQALAKGKITLSLRTLQKIKTSDIRKGNPFPVAEVAAMNAAKQTYVLIPHCHQIPLDTVSVSFKIVENGVEVTCLVRAQARTGVEMEALVGVTMALNTIWDMVKYLEKDDHGQYSSTELSEIRVEKKEKEII